jgi:hypothetical protein
MKPADISNHIAVISAGVSLLSGGIAFAAIRSSRKTAREQTALQAKLTVIEEERRAEERERRQQEDEAGRRAQLDTRIQPRHGGFHTTTRSSYSRSAGERRRWASRARASAAEAP